ncbi:MAG TPA: ferritin [Anaerolineae bacterium]|nr:ferritin [Anaerolineae bacterium]HNU05095.1 ferritin [Anaerolineae bacterium]
MLNSEIQQALNDQIQKEFHSAYIYLSMSAYFEAENLAGAASWMRKQAGEEQEHALKIFDFILDRGGHVVLQAIGQPAVDFASPLAVFEDAYAHERKVTQSIHDLYALALRQNDYPTQVMLQWFIDEQVEEEKTSSAIMAQLKMVGDSPAALLMIDRQLAARTSE